MIKAVEVFLGLAKVFRTHFPNDSLLRLWTTGRTPHLKESVFKSDVTP